MDQRRNTITSGQDGYDRIYRTYHTRVMRLCRMLLSEAHEAEDVAQEVFLKAFQRWKRGDEPDVWIAWLLRVTVNACHDRRGSAWWRWWHGSSDEFRDEHHSSQETPEEKLAGRDQYLRIWHHFRKLPSRQREIIVMRHLEGWSTEEVANALNLSTGSVKQHLFRAVRRLRKTVGDEREQLSRR